jgi:AraC-like DNA-binding protein
LILAYLPARLLRHLQFVLGSERAPLVAKTWDEIDTILQSKPVSVAVIDPSSDRPDRELELEQLMRSYPSLPVIAYLPLTAQAFGAVAHLAEKGLRHVVLYSHDDQDVKFLSLIDQVQTSPLTTRLLDELRPELAMLPLRLAKAVETLFAQPHLFPNAQDLSRVSAIPLVRSHRALRNAGFATPKRIFISAKLLKAYSYLGDPAHSVNAVAKKLGYRHKRILADHSNDLFGLNPSRLHAYMTEEQAIERVLASIRIGEGGKGSSGDGQKRQTPTDGRQESSN